MFIYELQNFIKVAETLNITKAAQELGMTQSGLSKAIKGIENELGVELFSRDKKNLLLTPAGVSFFAEANHFLVNCKHIKYGEEIGGKEPTGTLSILYTNRAEQVIDFMDVFLNINMIISEKYPGISIMLRRESGYATVAKVLGNKVDVAFMLQSSAITSDPGNMLDKYTIAENIPLMAAIPMNHPLANAKSVSVDDIKKEDMIMIEAAGRSEEQRALYSLFNYYGYIPHIVHMATDYESLYMLVGSGYGISIIPHSPFCKSYPNVKYVPIRKKQGETRNDAHTEYDLIMASSKNNSNPVLGIYTEIAKSVLDKHRHV